MLRQVFPDLLLIRQRSASIFYVAIKGNNSCCCCCFRRTPKGILPSFVWVLSLSLIYHCWLHFSELLFHATDTLPLLSRHVKASIISKLYFECVCWFLLPGYSFLVLLLLYRECYVFESEFLTLRRFFTVQCFLIFDACIASTCFPWSLRDFPLWFETYTQSICLFELRSVLETHNQSRALFKVVKIWSSITYGEKLNC